MKLLITALLAAAAALMPAAADEAPKLPEVRASSEDCAIFAVLGKAKLGWMAASAPEGNYIFQSTIGKGSSPGDTSEVRTYIAQCPWHELGMADPMSNPDGGEKNYALGYPAYTAPDEASATWNRFNFVAANGRLDLHHRFQLCKLAKHDGQWQIVSCDDEQDVVRASQPQR